MTVYNEEISRYISDLFAEEDDILASIRRQTVNAGLPDIGISAEEGRFLNFLVRAANVRLAVEIGTLGAYSTVWIARALAPGGKLISLEKSEKHASVARQHLNMANLLDRVEVRLGEAHQLLPKVARPGEVDFVFIDAEKEGYPAYWAWAVEHTRIGGIITAHNALWGGSVVGNTQGEAIDAVKQFNLLAANDSRVVSTIYPAGDGTLVAVRL